MDAEELYEDAACGFLSALPDGRIVRVNRTFLKLTGRSRDSVLAVRIQELLTEASRNLYHAQIPNPLGAQESVTKFSCDLLRADGSSLPALMNAVPVVGTTGQPVLLRFTFFDATEHRQAEINLQLARDRADKLALILQTHPDAILSVGSDGLVQSWNTAAERLFGYTAAQAVGAKLQELFIPNDEVGAIIAVLQAGRPAQRETQLATQAGVQVQAAITLTPHIDRSQGMTSVSIMVRDLGERKRLDDPLGYSEQLHRIAFDQSPTGMAYASPDGLFTRVNQRLCEISGFGAAELLRMKVLQLTHPHDLELDKELLDSFANGVAPTYENEKRYLRKDGTICWVAMTARMVRDEHGQPLQGVYVILDINERKEALQARRQSERRVRLATEAAQVGIWSWQPEKDIVEWENEYPYRILGLTSASSPVNAARFVTEFLHPDDLASIKQAVGAALQARQPFNTICRVRRADGLIRWIELTGSPEPNDGNRVPYVIGTLKDITERKRTEEHLQQLASLVESSDDALFGQDLNGLVTSWNHGAQLIFGYSEQEIVGQSIMRLIPAGGQAQEQELQRKIASGQRVGNFETMRLARDGRQFPVSITLSPIHDTSGKVIGASKVVRDISIQKQAEGALRQNAALFSKLISQAPMGTYVVDAQFRLQQINAEAMPIFSSVQPLIGRDFNEVMETLWGPEVGRQCSDIFRRTLVSGERYVSPQFVEMRQDLGIEQSFEWETQRVSLPDGQYGVVCYFHEVTERTRATEALRSSERRMRLAAEATGIGVWEWNVLTNRIKWDEQTFRLYGVAPTPDGWVDYRDWSEAVLAEDLAESEAILRETVRDGRRSVRAFRIRRRDNGQCRHIESVETARSNAEGVVEWVIGTNLDVSARQSAQDDLRRLAAALSESDRRKDEFLATLSHELRNPLATIRADVQLLPMTITSPVAFEQTRLRMERQVSLLARLVDDLMDVSRISQGKMNLRIEPLDLSQVIQAAVENSQAFIEQRRQVLKAYLPERPIQMNADAARLTQVFANLLTNAAKYSKPGETISISVERRGNFAVIAVRDNGVGIDPAEVPRLFEMFTQLDSATEEAQSGLGIGLHLVKRLVELHGGTVEVRSDGLGCGSEFLVQMPLELPNIAKSVPPRVAEKPIKLSFKAKYRILLADDNDDAAAPLSLLLEYEGHEVRIATDGEQAVELAKSWAPEVVLLDIGMPKLDGYEACRRIRSQRGGDQLLIVAVTGWGQEQDKIRAYRAGFDHHLVKPIDFAELDLLLHSPQAKDKKQGSS